MKKKVIAFILISLLSLSGCGTEKNASEGTADTASVTTVAATTEMVATTDVQIYEDIVDETTFLTYEDFLAEYGERRSTFYLHPLPDIVDTWELTSLTLYRSCYTMFYKDTANDVQIMLEIDYTSSYEKISEYFDRMNYSYGESEIPEITDRYAVKRYLEDDMYAIIGITGSENIMYTLVVSSKDETADPIALLKEYKELLEL
ncbi:MAG: hypothetical protein IJ496_06280 [Ruminococcus sp.]|nr:hypothetical protein [Ruminococcus sp.]